MLEDAPPVTEKKVVRPVLQPGQVLADATGRSCTRCGGQFADGERAVCTPPSCPSPRYAVWACAACYVPPGRNERLTEQRSQFGPLGAASRRSLTSGLGGCSPC